jgi:hypothetical protein
MMQSSIDSYLEQYKKTEEVLTSLRREFAFHFGLLSSDFDHVVDHRHLMWGRGLLDTEICFAPDRETYLAARQVEASPGTGPIGIRVYPKDSSSGYLFTDAPKDKRVRRIGDFVGLLMDCGNEQCALIIVRADKEMK